MRFNPQNKLTLHQQFLDYMNGKEIIPINLEISPTNYCNVECPWCFCKTDKKDIRNINKDILKVFLSDLKDLGLKSISWTGGGEPSIYPNLAEVSYHCWKLGLEQGIFTNAISRISYDPSMFSWIRVSKTNKDWPENNIKILREGVKVLGLCVNYTGDKNQVYEALEIGHKIDVNYVQIRPALESKGLKVNIEIPDIEDPLLIITRYKFEEAKIDRDYTSCEGFHFVPFLWEDGNLDACAYHKGNSEFNIGNIYENNALELIKMMPKSFNTIPTCQICCKNHEINKLINNSKKINDINFV